ncbi:glycosyltransferase family 4 protein [Cohaesibacter celericrescens]|uniref:glycosyltransferase family 4 protein n=1 Tax=Cohaesibacter celericrescens TaxID=2067669 RepID=UPI0035629D93
MKIAIILPRHMFFGPQYATAIDLCVKEFVSNSRFKTDTKIFGAEIDTPFEGLAFQPIHKHGEGISFNQLVRELKLYDPDVIVVQQHVPTARKLKSHFQNKAFVLHKHNNPAQNISFIKSIRETMDFGFIDETIFVSEYSRNILLQRKPTLSEKTHVVHNGIDVSQRQPFLSKTQKILFAGRAVPEKGALEAIQAVANIVNQNRDWKASFVLSTLGMSESYLAAIQQAFSNINPEQASLKFDLSHEQVMQEFDASSVSIVPSIFNEPFGRTALESLASGAALVTSMRGGIREIAGDIGIAITPTSIQSITDALQKLISQKDEITRLGMVGRQRACSLFDIKKKAAQIDEIYVKAMNKKHLTLAA